MNETFKTKIMDELLIKYNELINSDYRDSKEIGDKSGIYVFYENDEPIYVGRTRNFKSRYQGHRIASSHNSASFAFLLSKEIFENRGGEKFSSRKKFMGDEVFKQIMKEQCQRIKQMQIRFIEIKNDPELQYAFELYAAIALETTKRFSNKYNCFETH